MYPMHGRTAWERGMATYSSHINVLLDGLRCRLRTIKYRAVRVAMILMACGLHTRHHEQ